MLLRRNDIKLNCVDDYVVYAHRMVWRREVEQKKVFHKRFAPDARFPFTEKNRFAFAIVLDCVSDYDDSRHWMKLLLPGAFIGFSIY